MQAFEAILYVYVKIIPNPSTITLLEKVNALQWLLGTLNYCLQVNNHTYSYRIPCTRTLLPFPEHDFWSQPTGDLCLQSGGHSWSLLLIFFFIFWGPWGLAMLHFLCMHTPLTGSEKCRVARLGFNDQSSA